MSFNPAVGISFYVDPKPKTAPMLLYQPTGVEQKRIQKKRKIIKHTFSKGNLSYEITAKLKDGRIKEKRNTPYRIVNWYVNP